MTDKLSPKGLVGLCQSEEGGIQSTRKRKTNYEDVGCCSGKAMAVVVDQECEMYLAAEETVVREIKLGSWTRLRKTLKCRAK